MFRALMLGPLALVCSCAYALAASEADKQSCVSNQNPDSRIEACTHLLADTAIPTPLRALAYRSRAAAYAGKKLYALAELDLDETIKLDPKDTAAYSGRARVLFRRGQYDRAIADFTEQLRLSPGNSMVLNNRGIAYSRKGDTAAAMADYDEALRTNPRNVRAHNNRGRLLARQHKLDQAIAEYDEALRIDPDHILAYLNRARAYEEKGALEQAVADYRQIVQREGSAREDEVEPATPTAAKRQLERLTKVIAEGKAPVERRIALVIGNSAYQHVPALLNPLNDAKKVAAALRASGFTEVHELPDATLAVMSKELKDFGDLATGAEWAVIYFAGHGMEVDGNNYLIPVDAALEQQNHVDDEAMPLSRVLGKVAGASKMQLVILDACRNNPFVSKMRPSGRGPRAIGRGLASIEPDGGVLIAYAARDGTTALDGESANSPYADSLAKYLTEPGLEISLMFRKVRDDVLSRTGRQQEPFTYGSLPAQPFYFKR